MPKPPTDLSIKATPEQVADAILRGGGVKGSTTRREPVESKRN